jgi:hypothetical protein
LRVWKVRPLSDGTSWPSINSSFGLEAAIGVASWPWSYAIDIIFPPFLVIQDREKFANNEYDITYL